MDIQNNRITRMETKSPFHRYQFTEKTASPLQTLIHRPETISLTFDDTNSHSTSSSSYSSPAISLGFTILGEIFAYETVFNPTIEVVIFRLRGWCMLAVFLLLVFSRLVHECQYKWIELYK